MNSAERIDTTDIKGWLVVESGQAGNRARGKLRFCFDGCCRGLGGTQTMLIARQYKYKRRDALSPAERPRCRIQMPVACKPLAGSTLPSHRPEQTNSTRSFDPEGAVARKKLTRVPFAPGRAAG